VPADDAGGEDEIKAVLVADGEGVDAAAVWSWCDERLPYFAVPRYVEFVPVLPKTATAKVQKTELRAAGVTSATADRGPAPSRRGRR
jgi:crotonobetaine/carnitine-CoA ligase